MRKGKRFIHIVIAWLLSVAPGFFPTPLNEYFLNTMEKILKKPWIRLAKKGFDKENQQLKEAYLDLIRHLRESYIKNRLFG